MSMEPPDYQKHLVLFVDDEDKTRKYFKRLFGKTFRIVLASDGVEALEILRQQTDDIGLIVTDQKMPHETGLAFLEKAVLLKPSIVRILSTAFADVETAIDSVNKGGVYRYVTKPWDVADFEMTLRRAMEYYLLQNDRNELVRKQIASLEQIAMADRVLSLAALAATRDSGLRHLGEGISALMHLHGMHSSAASPLVAENAWSGLYKRHHAFLAKALALLPKNTSPQPRLDPESGVHADEVMAQAAKGKASFTLAHQAGKGVSWPGPAAVATEVVSALFAGLQAIAQPSDVIGVASHGGSVELSLPHASIAKALEPLFGTTSAAPEEATFALVAGFLKFADAGGTFETVAMAGENEVGLRIGFEPSRIMSPAGDSIEAIAADLIGNELFWSRVL